MAPVKDYKYRELPTPGGLRAMEKGTLQWFDTEMYANMNTGILEEYLEEKNRKEGFKVSTFIWWKVILGICIGTAFAVITEYVALKVGMGISGGIYIAYLIGMALRWKPSEINIVGASTSAATMICMGFIFTFPAIYLLAYDPSYAIGFEGGKPIYLITKIPSIGIIIVPAIIAGWLGVVYFIIFRRLWLIDDPLHVPGFEPNLKLLDIAHDISKGGVEQAKKSIKIVSLWIFGTAIFTFLRDFPIIDKKSPLDAWFGGDYYGAGELKQPEETAHYTFISFAFLPIQFGIGWFMRFRVALLVNLGTFLTWFIVVPMAIAFHVPVFDIEQQAFVDVSTYTFPAWIAYRKIGTIVGIGALLGGGVFAIIKMTPMFKSAMGDVMKAIKMEEHAEGKEDYVKGKGWYEWPLSHILIIAILAIIVITTVFTFGGYPFIQSFIFALVLAFTTFLLGAIAVKTLGETGTEPVSATSIIVLLLLIFLFLAIGTPKELVAVMALIGTTIFCSAISMSGDIIWDFKVGLYVGNRPYHLTKGVLTAIIPGAIASAIAAAFFSYGLATGELNLIAPQARVFATLTQLIFSGQSNELVIQYLIIGVAIGIFMEIMTGMGTAFGLGMYFPLSIQLPMLVGGALRDIWEKKVLEPRAKREKWSERKRTLKVLDTYMAATGLMVGEAVMATIAAIWIMSIM